MTPRKYHIIWRALAGLVALATLPLVPLALMGRIAAPGWAEGAGIALVLVLLPYVAITGRAPAWFERSSRDVR